jgi:hypothetical protein
MRDWRKWHLRARHASRSGHSATYWSLLTLILLAAGATSNGAVTFHWSAPRRQSNLDLNFLLRITDKDATLAPGRGRYCIVPNIVRGFII